MANFTNHLRMEDHPNWVGDDARYSTKHSWARRTIRKTGVCSKCGVGAKTDLCNVDHRYVRSPEFWFEACRTCHIRYDIANGLRNPHTPNKIQKTHCKKGHAYVDGSYYQNPRTGKRACRICRTESRKKWLN